MARSIAEHTLSRACDYLSAMGVELTREVTLRALTLVEAGLASQAGRSTAICDDKNP